MFHRIVHEDWVAMIPAISFWLLFAVFVAATVRSLCMRRDEAQRMAALPLDDTAPPHPAATRPRDPGRS